MLEGSSTRRRFFSNFGNFCDFFDDVQDFRTKWRATPNDVRDPHIMGVNRPHKTGQLSERHFGELSGVLRKPAMNYRYKGKIGFTNAREL